MSTLEVIHETLIVHCSWRYFQPPVSSFFSFLCSCFAENGPSPYSHWTLNTEHLAKHNCSLTPNRWLDKRTDSLFFLLDCLLWSAIVFLQTATTHSLPSLCHRCHWLSSFSLSETLTLQEPYSSVSSQWSIWLMLPVPSSKKGKDAGYY